MIKKRKFTQFRRVVACLGCDVPENAPILARVGIARVARVFAHAAWYG